MNDLTNRNNVVCHAFTVLRLSFLNTIRLWPSSVDEQEVHTMWGSIEASASKNTSEKCYFVILSFLHSLILLFNLLYILLRYTRACIVFVAIEISILPNVVYQSCCIENVTIKLTINKYLFKMCY